MAESKKQEADFVLVESKDSGGFLNICPVIGPEMGNILSQGKFKIGINHEKGSYYLGLKPKPCKFCEGKHNLPELFSDAASAEAFYKTFCMQETALEADRYIAIETEEVVDGEALVEV